jgi:HD-GYP domain-containing protein (c-di-GMP phosphodiesterase class II)
MAAGYNVNNLNKIGIGALLHDLGKIQIPRGIINKPGRLTSDEMSCIKEHPQAGFNILRKNNNFSLLSAHIALEHHEKFDGSGYPQGIEGEEIHEFARLTAICDVYDALTSDRPYRKGMPAHQAYDTLLAGSGSQFDPEFLRIFVQHIAIYPMGGFVELNTGEIAVVTRITAGVPWRPCVMPVLDANKQKILQWEEINLARTFNITISRVLEEEECLQFCSNVTQNKKKYDAQISQ